MGNYHNFEQDFIDRTLALISQYESILHRYDFEHQYNYTLLLNCLLGIIVMPRSRIYSHKPNHRLTIKLREEMGLSESYIDPNYTTIRELISALRNSIAHINIEVESENDDFLIDKITFKRPYPSDSVVASFKATEILPFLRYYSSWINSNLDQNP